MWWKSEKCLVNNQIITACRTNSNLLILQRMWRTMKKKLVINKISYKVLGKHSSFHTNAPPDTLLSRLAREELKD